MDPIIDVREWNTIVADQPHSPFLQSYEWGEFQKIMGHGVERILFYNEKKSAVVFQVFVYALGGGFSYLYVPHGPIGDYEEGERARLQKEIREIQKRTKAIFLRWEPKSEKENFIICAKQKKTTSIQPQTTRILSVEQDPDALLSGMHPKTRYNIRVAEKHGVEIHIDDAPSPKTEKEFLSILKETARRDHFHLHDDTYYHKLLDLFQKASQDDHTKPFTRLYTAWAKEQMLAGAIVLFFGDTATYLHGASSLLQRNVMAPYALHWHIIEETKKMGYPYYDFWGIAETDDATHPWAGLTRFKKGFGGSVLTYPQAKDCIFSPFLYTLYSYARALHRMKRR